MDKPQIKSSITVRGKILTERNKANFEWLRSLWIDHATLNKELQSLGPLNKEYDVEITIKVK